MSDCRMLLHCQAHPNLAKRMECAQLAAAFKHPAPYDSGSKLRALHTLRARGSLMEMGETFGSACAAAFASASVSKIRVRCSGDGRTPLKRYETASWAACASAIQQKLGVNE